MYWLNKGVDGFRVDAVPHLFESNTFADEPLSGATVDKSDWNYLSHIYTKDQPETVDFVYQLREFIDNYTEEHGGDTR